MVPLSMKPEQIIKHIDLRNHKWKNISDSNCYAFALGLDLNEDEIGNDYYYAYQPGVIGLVANGMEIDQIYGMKFEERIFLDWDTLKIKYRQVDFDEKIEYSYIKDELYRWKIALYLQYSKYNHMFYEGYDCDFHFIRQFEDCSWHSKLDYGATPREVAQNIDYKKDIKHLDGLDNIKYDFYKCYELTMSKR